MARKKRNLVKRPKIRISPLASISFISIAIIGTLIGLVVMRFHIPLGIAVLLISGVLTVAYIQTIEKGLF